MISNKIITTSNLRLGMPHIIFLTFLYVGGKKLETFKKNEVKTGKVIDLTHEGHGVVKVYRNTISLSKTNMNLPTISAQCISRL